MKRLWLAGLALALAVQAEGPARNYYRFPALWKNVLVFSAEGDLWRVDAGGGMARRLTTSPGEESYPAVSPDGATLAFSADYEGPTEVYTMPLDGGLPQRRTFDGGAAVVAGWMPDGKVLYATRRYSTLPDAQLATIDAHNRVELIPLSQAAAGAYDPRGRTLFFTRLPFQGSSTKRYQGGTAEKLWKYTLGSAEAEPLSADYSGTSKAPMWWNGKLYFASDRDGSMNLWSMDANGKGLKPLTHHRGWDVASPSLSEGRIAYQLGADIHIYDIARGADLVVPIELPTDLDHLREHWVKDPIDYVTEAQLSPDGGKLVLTARGKVFVVPAVQGRLVDATYSQGHRFRSARMMPDGKSLLAISSESGELEFWKLPANGLGAPQQLTSDGHVMRWEGTPSPDGKWVVHHDKDLQLWLLNTETREQKRIAVSEAAMTLQGFSDIAWSPDSRWFAYVTPADNDFDQIRMYSVESGAITPVTTDRFNSSSPCWSPDGKWLYFLSDRELKTVVPAPWGPRAPDPFFDRATKLYALALRRDERSPFQPADELHENPPAPENGGKPADGKPAAPPKVEIDLDGIAARIQAVPVPAGNYRQLAVNAKRLFFVDGERGKPDSAVVMAFAISNDPKAKPEKLVEGVRGFELSADGKKIAVRKGNDFFVLDAAVKEDALKNPKTLEDAKVDLKNWTFSVIPSEEYREAFVDAWRMERDYFYDRGMNGVDWKGMREKYQPLVERVRSRAELNDLLAQMMGELSALHTFIRGGDLRRGPDQVAVAALGARLARDEDNGGYRVVHIYRNDPDLPEKASPLARPGVDLHENDVITRINGADVLSVPAPEALLRNQAGRQVLLSVKPGGKGDTRQVIVYPMSAAQENDLRYGEWEYTRRQLVDKLGAGQLGYVHLRAMTAPDIEQWAREYYPVFNRQGLIIDVRHNGGGNIDSWLLGKLLRRAWFYWQGRVGKPSWNMQYAFRGPMVVLCDEHTGSDGEAFTEGFRRLGLGKAIGVRTWGGEIWLSMSNVLADRGVASAAEFGVYADGKWLIEGHGVDPDVVVDNLPHATFGGQDAQLEAGIRYLQDQLKEKPVSVPPPPAYPKKGL